MNEAILKNITINEKIKYLAKCLIANVEAVETMATMANANTEGYELLVKNHIDLLNHSVLGNPEPTSMEPTDEMKTLYANVIRACESGDRIRAIRELRILTNCGLCEAKDEIERVYLFPAVTYGYSDGREQRKVVREGKWLVDTWTFRNHTIGTNLSHPIPAQVEEKKPASKKKSKKSTK